MQSHYEAGKFQDSDTAAGEGKSHGHSNQQQSVLTAIRSRFHSGADLEGVSMARKGETDVNVGDIPKKISQVNSDSPMVMKVLGCIFFCAALFIFGSMLYMLTLPGHDFSQGHTATETDIPKPRKPSEKMKMDLVAHVVKATHVPSSSASGEFAPFVEIRCVKDDPETRNGGLSDNTKAKQRTQAKACSQDPVWNETLTLSKIVYGPSYSINIILWDSGEGERTSQQKAIGYHSVPLTELLSGVKYDPEHDSTRLQGLKDYTARGFVSLVSNRHEVFPSVVNLFVGYLEIHKFEVCINNASLLPSLNEEDDSLTTCVEVRIVHGNPEKFDFHITPHHETSWHGRTKTVHGNSNPGYHDQLNFTVAANPSHYIQICVLAIEESGIGSTPIGMIAVPLSQIMTNTLACEKFSKTLQRLPNWPEPENLSAAELNFSITHKLAVANE
jgi:hypothetical protein